MKFDFESNVKTRRDTRSDFGDQEPVPLHPQEEPVRKPVHCTRIAESCTSLHHAHESKGAKKNESRPGYRKRGT